MKYSIFKKHMLNRYCRSCINKKCSIHLKQENCIYAVYQNKCQQCGEMKNIVEDLRWNAKGKILMLKDFTLILILLLTAGFGMPDSVLAASQKLPSGISYTELEADIDDYVEEHMETTVGMEAAVFTKDDILFQKEYGYVDKENNIKMDADSVLDWGSITKTLVWVSAMQLKESGQLDLEEDIREYLPDGFLTNLRYEAPVTMTDLMNHQGGFQENFADLYITDSDKVLPLAEQLQKNPPAQIFEPETVTSYSNWGTALAGYVIECASGQTFDAYVKEHIFDPLGMKHTALLPDLSDQEGVLQSRLETKCYSAAGKPHSVSFYHIGLYPCGMCAGTLDDLILYTQALIPDENKPCPLFKNKDTLIELFTPTAYIGGSKNARLCHGFIVDYYKVPVLGHGGNSYGCSAQLYIDQESGIGTVVMTNQYLEETYTKKMMSLIYGTYDTASNLGMPKASEDKPFRISRTFWEGPLSILNTLMLYTGFGTPGDNLPWTISQDGKRFECADIVDYVFISPVQAAISLTLIGLLCLVILYITAAGGINGLILTPVKKLRLKKQNMVYSPHSLACWHYCSCGLIAAWILNSAAIIYEAGIIYSPSSHYLWQIAANGILGFAMLAAGLWSIIHRKEARQIKFGRLRLFMTSLCLLVSFITILWFDMYQFWNL